jgi:hypothetical protein
MLERHNLEDGKWKTLAKILLKHLQKRTHKDSKRTFLIFRKSRQNLNKIQVFSMRYKTSWGLRVFNS